MSIPSPHEDASKPTCFSKIKEGEEGLEYLSGLLCQIDREPWQRPLNVK